MNGVNVSQHRGGKSRVQVFSLSRTLLCRLEHQSSEDLVWRPLVSPGFLRNAFAREGTDALPGLLPARTETPAQRGRAGLSRCRGPTTAPPRASPSPLLLRPHLTYTTLHAEAAFKVLFKTFPSSKKTRDYALYFPAIHRWCGGEWKVPVCADKKGEGSKILPPPKLAVMRVHLKAGL